MKKNFKQFFSMWVHFGRFSIWIWEKIMYPRIVGNDIPTAIYRNRIGFLFNFDFFCSPFCESWSFVDQGRYIKLSKYFVDFYI